MARDLATGMCFYDPFGSKAMQDNLKNTVAQLCSTNKHVWVVELLYDYEGLNNTSMRDQVDRRCKWLTLRSSSLMWHKEQMLNRLAEHLITIEDYDAVNMVDADILFTNDDWAQRIRAQLEDYQVVQSYSEGKSGWQPGGACQSERQGVVARWMKKQSTNANYPGGGWAARAEVWLDAGLFEYNLVGGGDTAFASALLYPLVGGDYWLEFPWSKISGTYQEAYHNYRECLNEIVGSSISYVKQEALFQIHGARSNRNYINRHRLLQDIDLRPGKELHRNTDGLLEWVHLDGERARKISQYFLGRDCDNDNEGAATPVECVCLKKCFLEDGRLCEPGKTYHLLPRQVNHHFELAWARRT